MIDDDENIPIYEPKPEPEDDGEETVYEFHSSNIKPMKPWVAKLILWAIVIGGIAIGTILFLFLFALFIYLFIPLLIIALILGGLKYWTRR